MSEQLYRIISDDTPEPAMVAFDDDGEYLGALVPVERCEHRRVEGHQWWDRDTDHAVWCPGSPTLEVDDE